MSVTAAAAILQITFYLLPCFSLWHVKASVIIVTTTRRQRSNLFGFNCKLSCVNQWPLSVEAITHPTLD